VTDHRRLAVLADQVDEGLVDDDLFVPNPAGDQDPERLSVPLAGAAATAADRLEKVGAAWGPAIVPAPEHGVVARFGLGQARDKQCRAARTSRRDRAGSDMTPLSEKGAGAGREDSRRPIFLGRRNVFPLERFSPRAGS
jgi:hypothetical protein